MVKPLAKKYHSLKKEYAQQISNLKNSPTTGTSLTTG